MLPEETNAPLHFDNQIIENDLNDSYDHKKLMKLIPKRFEENARKLIDSFDELSNEITWDSKGTVYIDQISIPNSNIYTIFPRLFKRPLAQKVPGLIQIFEKLKVLGLSSLCGDHEIQSGQGSESKAVKNQWWYIGP